MATVTNLSDYPWVEVNRKGNVFILPELLAEWMRNEYHVKVSENGKVYLYDDGIFRRYEYQELMGKIKEHIPYEDRKMKDVDTVYRELTTDRSSVKLCEFNAREDLVAFEDGVLNIRTMELLPHSPDYLLTRKLPCKYVKDASLTNAPIFSKFLDDLQRNDPQAIDFILEYMGAIFSNVFGWRYKKMLLLVGPGGSGKSKLRELIVSILGKEHSLSIDLRNLVARFGTYGLMGKRLGGSGDVASVDLEEISVLKDLTGGDDLFAEPKGKDGTSYRYDGFLFFVSNHLPYFRGDRGQHIYQRFQIVRCEQPVPEDQRDPHLLDKMLAEKETIINVCIAHFIGTVHRGYRFIDTEFMQCERDNYQIANNSLFTFVSSCCSRGGSTKRSMFNSIYRLWCDDNNIRGERPKDIGAQMEEQFKMAAKKTDGGIFNYPLTINDEVMMEYADRASDKPRRR